jgi:tetratricopeptide (TPR) repeat protein
MRCPDPQELLDLVEGRLSDERAAALERHLDECPACGATVAGYIDVPADAARPDDGLRPGDPVGRYQIAELLGAGGMGRVYAAIDPDLGRRVALKLVRDAGGSAEEARDRQARLLREAQAMARLAHPNVVAIHDVGTFGDRVFTAMELIDGETLADWLQREARRPAEILAVFVQAGRGLAAAHAAGLVHRDFKPANVLIGTDGRVRVTDFGLARPAPIDAASAAAPDAGEPSSTESGRVALAVPVLIATETGAVFGTPLYMAPEQHLGLPTDARSDQFSFCVALYEALYRQRPFSGLTAGDVAVEVTAGRVRPPPSSRVPVRVARALARGLRVAPEERHPSMEALLDQLAADPARRRRALLAGVGAAAAAAAVLLVTRAAPGPAPCGGAAPFVAEAWSEPRRTAIRAAFEKSSDPRAAKSLARVEALLDRHAERLAATHTATCQATRVSGEQPEEVLGLRMACLERQRAELAALGDVLSRADAAVAARALEAAYALPPTSECDAARVLSSRAPPPPADLAPRVDAIQAELVRIKALYDAGQYRQARDLARTASSEATALGYRPLETEALYRLGLSEMSLHESPSAEKAMTSALVAATAAGLEARAADATMALAYLTGIEMGRQDEGLRWQRQAQALVERVGGRDKRAADAASLAGLIARSGRRHAEALDHFQRAAELYRQVLGPDHPLVALMSTYAGTMLGQLRRADEAEKAHRQALAIFEAAYGPEHPDLAIALSNLGVLMTDLGKFSDALALHQRAAAIEETVRGRESPGLAPMCANLGRARAAMGDMEGARREFLRALAVTEKAYGRRHPEAISALRNTAITHAMEGHLDLAAPLFEEALTLSESLHGPDHLQVASALADIGQLHRAQGRPREAAASLERALSIREKLGGSDPAVVSIVTELAATELELGRPKPAAARLERMLDLADQSSPIAGAEVRFLLARALRADRREEGRVRRLAEEARAVFAKAGMKDESAAVDRFLRRKR